MFELDQARRGFLAGGNFVVDMVKRIDGWPEQDTLCTVLDRRRSNGGGPYNLLKNLARLDPALPLAACGLVGEDPEGEWLLEDCRAAGIEVARLRARPGLATSVTDVMSVDGTGHRTFFHQPGANAALDERDFDFAGCRARVFHLGYLTLLPRLDEIDGGGATGAARVLRRARGAGMLTAVDCVSGEHPRFREIAVAALREADVFLANEIEAGFVLGRGVAEGGVEAALREIHALGARGLVVLHLAAAAYAFDGERVWRQAALRVPAAEIAGTTGAGDAFATGLLHGLHEGCAIEESLWRGVCVAASCLRDATPSGGVLPLAECLALGEDRGRR